MNPFPDCKSFNLIDVYWICGHVFVLTNGRSTGPQYETWPSQTHPDRQITGSWSHGSAIRNTGTILRVEVCVTNVSIRRKQVQNQILHQNLQRPSPDPHQDPTPGTIKGRYVGLHPPHTPTVTSKSVLSMSILVPRDRPLGPPMSLFWQWLT